MILQYKEFSTFGQLQDHCLFLPENHRVISVQEVWRPSRLYDYVDGLYRNTDFHQVFVLWYEENPQPPMYSITMMPNIPPAVAGPL